MAENSVTHKKSAIDLIHYIITKHHEFLRRETPVLKRLVSELPDTPTSLSCKVNLDLLLKDMSEHLMREERVLFPTIEEIELSIIEERPAKVMACGIKGPISKMVSEHIEAKDLLMMLDQNCKKAGHEEFRKAVQSLKEDLMEHIRVEEEELFPLAVEICEEK